MSPGTVSNLLIRFSVFFLLYTESPSNVC